MTTGKASIRAVLAAGLLVWQSAAQNPPIMVPPARRPAQKPPAATPGGQPGQRPPATTQPARPGQQPQPAGAKPAQPATAPQRGTARATLTDTGGFMLENVSLSELIDIIARRLKINYLLDPRFKGGSVTIHTYGEVKPADLMPLLETILRVNGAALIKVGDLYRVVPVEKVTQLPLAPTVDGKNFPEDEGMSLNLIFLKYATASEMLKLIQPFLGEGATAAVYDPANLLILQDSNRSMKRTVQLLGLFDSDAFVNQRVRMFDVRHGRPEDLAKQMETLFKALSLSEKTSAVKFLAIDRINTIIAVASNPTVFDQVDKWLKKLDVPPKTPAGAVDNYVYRLKYGRSETVAMALMALYSGNPMALMALSAMSNSMMGNGFGGMGMGGAGTPLSSMGYSGGGFGGGVGGMGYGGMGGMGGMGYGGMGYGGMGYGGMGYGGMGYGGMGYGGTTNPYSSPLAGASSALATAQSGGAPGAADQTGTYLGAQAQGSRGSMRMPHIIPNPFDNTLLVQCTPEEWEQISRLLTQLDVPPRQILVEAKIFEVTLTGDLQYGVTAYLQSKGATAPSGFTKPGTPGGFLANTAGQALTMTGGLLVGHGRQLLAQLTALETSGKAKTINEPSLIATDSVPATMNVGQSVPTLSSSVASGVQQGGSTLFANNISNVSAGVTLNVLARVNSSGIITMLINQQVSNPQAPASDAAIQSDSFSNRSFQTQITVQDGDTVAIGGIIQESTTEASGGVPVLQRIPIIGAAFGGKSRSTSRTELIAIFTPHVIYDTTSLAEASDDLKTKLKHLKKELSQE